MDEETIRIQRQAETALKAIQDGIEGCEELAARALGELRLALKSFPSEGKTLGPWIGSLTSALRIGQQAEKIRWVAVHEGHLSIGHRPKLDSLRGLRQQGATHIVTLLAESEGAREIGKAAEAAGIGWIWFPLESAGIPSEDRDREIIHLFQEMAFALAGGAKIYIHCSAGIHRTGMVTYGFLRSVGIGRADARTILKTAREHTAAEVGEDRLAWGDRFESPKG